jgi:hypothetical protein
MNHIIILPTQSFHTLSDGMTVTSLSASLLQKICMVMDCLYQIVLHLKIIA